VAVVVRGGVVITYESLMAERYGEPTWFAKPSDAAKADDEVTCRRRLASCVAEADEVADGRGRWVMRRGIKVWKASA
jgi:hypothetical protein